MGGSCFKGKAKSINLKVTEKINIKRHSLSKKISLYSPKKTRNSIRSSAYIINEEDINNVYIFQQQLGTGYYGTVKIAVPKNDPNKRYAVKSIDKSKLCNEKINKLIREIEVLGSVDHPNIIKYYETFNDDKYFHIVMEHCTGGELFERIIKNKYFSENEASIIMYKIAGAISHCHGEGVVHRDLKPENILYENNSEFSDIKIIDFGLSRKYDSGKEELHSIVGSPYYVAPEVLEGTYDCKCDIWSIGVLMYVLLSGRPPFYSENKIELYYKIRNENPDFSHPVWHDVSQEAKDLIRELLSKSPLKRPKANRLIEHVWFKKAFQENENKFIDRQILLNLRAFQEPFRLKKALMQFLVKNMKSTEIENLKLSFNLFDTKKTGFIELNQLKEAFESTGVSYQMDELKAILNNCNLGKKERINYSSFIAAATDKKAIYNRELLWTTFKHIDVDDTGFITVDDLLRSLRRTGKAKKKEDLEDMFKEAGYDADNKINFEEFCQLIERDI